MDESIVVSYSYRRRNIDGGDPPSGRLYEGSVKHVINQSVNNSAVNPNWRDDIKNGNCATTFLTGHRESLSRSACNFDVASSHGDFIRGSDCDDQLPWRCSDPSGSSISQADNQAKQKLVRKANEYQRPFSGGVFLGELRETLRMLRNPAAALSNGIMKHIDQARKRSRGLKPGSNPYRKTASGMWLEAVFGWLPLFSDIEDANKALSKLANNASKRRKLIIAEGSSETVSDTNLGETLYAGADISAYYAYRQTTSVNVRYRAMLQWDSSLYSKFRYFGLTPSDILPTAWELVPGSFLADYFTNIGEILEGYSFGTSRLRWVDRGYCVKSERTFRCDRWNPSLSPNGPGVGWFTPETITSRREYVRREEIDNFDPVPDIVFQLPGLRQTANMTALASSKSKFL